MLAAILVVFGVIFIAELPDKSMFASLALSTRFRKSYVWAGAATAFLVHVIIAVTAGHFMTLLPRKLLEGIIGGLFLLGAGLLFFGKDEDEAEERKKLEKQTRGATDGFLKVFTTSFVVIFLGEWGDITQIATANYAAKYHDPWGVGIGAVAALWTVAALGVTLGSKLLNRVPARTLKRITAVILLIFAAISLFAAFK
ncbi:MAG TPA: TMEM165/GDT1 family protein [Candidatus Saccharimonadales bacterium]|jgi:putative Ca2+/H+ antiporter (TMEM165/GDT1 family)